MQLRTSLDVSAPGHCFWILNWTCYLRTPFCHFRYCTRVFYQEVPGFATDCPCGVWWHWLTTCLLYVGPHFGNLVWKKHWVSKWDMRYKGERRLHCFNRVCIYVFTYILMSHNMIIPYFYLPYFHVSNGALLFAKHSGTLHLHRHSPHALYMIFDGITMMWYLL